MSRQSLLASVSLLLATFACQGEPWVDKDTRQFLDALAAGGGKPLETLSPTAARAVLTGAQQSVAVDMSGIEVEHKSVAVAGKPLKLVLVKPAAAKGPLPVFMFFHGGGWVLGDYPTHARLIRDLVVNSGAAAVYVDYAPSPESQYPTAINQAYDATLWVAQHGREWGLDPRHLAVAGNSVGGNMAAAVSLMAKDKGKPAIGFQLLLWPVTDARFDTPSYQQFAQGHFLTLPMMKWFWDAYTTDPKERAQYYASPLRASLAELKGLPPALVQTAECDVLRDEGEAYAHKLDAAGVPVTATRYNGMIHDYGLLNPLASNSTVQAALRQAGEELRHHLH
ncbi:alpha/beta hydrolase [Gallaecimonas xiamenensis]|uniref:Alpha/beta hydrolase domain-containing protein n=1 Tax=Gallaecimonas xiamenensis 3-C-1 TaxID=745411 RepID=K2JXT1_9GAMM|nr:alpha/beta hydrolase [Gallaecimonas xiamenensis]EKE75114.1 alpha/beta hydrolase domain-containing protein [Gallaecimonas xiamenensis 3-C-1]